MENCEFSKDNMKGHYDEIAGLYDEIYLSAGFYDHIKCSELAQKLFPDVEKRKNLHIFDMGCGTGLVGEEMQKNGFENIVGCDVSTGMMEVAAKKNDGKAYAKVIELYLGQPERFPDALKG